MSKNKLSAFRRDELGFIFQDSNLLDTLTGMVNIAHCPYHQGRASREHHLPHRGYSAHAQCHGIAQAVSQPDVRWPKQRVAAARAIVADPSLILADEPTGALDSRNATIMLETLEMLNKSLNATILMVTHDAYAASFSDRVLFLSDGKLFNEIRQGSLSREEYFARIMEVVTFLGGEAYHAA